jgi:L-iditol 2-dehydrogenase
MLVAELTAPREFRLKAEDISAPGPGEVQVRVESVGICGSDLHSYAEGAIGDTPCTYPMVLGHEPAGVVVACGAGVTGWSPGDRAALEPALYCYHCEFCRAGRYNICANIRFLSNPGTPGFFRDRINLPSSNLVALPAHVSLDAASLVEPLAVAMHSIRLMGASSGETAAVFGAGPIGLLTIACLRAEGVERIWAVDPVPHRREMALLLGAQAALDPNRIDPARQILADTNGRGVDCALDCAAREQTTNQTIRAARNGGRIALTKELVLFNVRRSNQESTPALQFLAERPANFELLLTHTRSLDRIADAFHIAETYADGVGKMIVKP